MSAEALLQQLDAPLPHLPHLSAAFAETFHALALTSHTQFLPTPVRALPSGTERGHFLALDLGGTNLRVAHIELLAPHTRTHAQHSWPVPSALKSSTAESLFTWVAQRILDLLRSSPPGAPPLDGVCITFSFPTRQTAHTAAQLMPMGKGFTFTQTSDLAALLAAAYAAAARAPGDPPLPRILAITNDAVATLLAAAYAHPGAAVAAAVIAGTGTNAACVCPLRKLHPRKHPADPTAAGSILLNTEWSVNGSAPPLRDYTTPWDRALDAGNEKPGFQPLEEMVGGRYLGELVRRVWLDVAPAGAGAGAPQMQVEYGVDTGLCAGVEAAGSDAGAAQVLGAYFGGGPWDVQAAAAFRGVCERVSGRAAALVAAATVGVLAMNGELEGGGGEVLVGYTGAVMERYPGFRERCEGFMQAIVREGGGGAAVRLVEARDGGVVGAAVLAAMVKSGRT